MATCKVVSPQPPQRGTTKLNYADGISAQTVGSERLCMKLVTIPPGAASKAHLHEHHETAVYVLSGEGATWFGEGLKEHLSAKAGQFMYIPANMPHITYNPSSTEPCIAVIARTDANDQESVTEYRTVDSRAE